MIRRFQDLASCILQSPSLNAGHLHPPQTSISAGWIPCLVKLPRVWNVRFECIANAASNCIFSYKWPRISSFRNRHSVSSKANALTEPLDGFISFDSSLCISCEQVHSRLSGLTLSKQGYYLEKQRQTILGEIPTRLDSQNNGTWRSTIQPVSKRCWKLKCCRGFGLKYWISTA